MSTHEPCEAKMTVRRSGEVLQVLQMIDFFWNVSNEVLIRIEGASYANNPIDIEILVSY